VGSPLRIRAGRWFIFAGHGLRYCLIHAIRYTEATVIAPLGYLSMVFALQGYLVWDETSAPGVVGGTALVVASGFLILYGERHLS